MSSFVGSVALELRKVVAPLRDYFNSAEQFRALLARLGWGVDLVDDSTMSLIRAGFAIEGLIKTAEQIAAQLEQGGGDEAKLAAQLLQALAPILDAIRKLVTTPPQGLPFPLDQSEFWSEAPLALVDDLFTTYLERERPALFGVLFFLGLVDIEEQNPLTPGRVFYLRRRVRWDRIPNAVSDPEALFRDVYKWNDQTAPFAHRRFLEALQRFFWALGIGAWQRLPPPALATRFYDVTNPALPAIRELVIPILSSFPEGEAASIVLGLSVLPIAGGTAAKTPPVGFVLGPIAIGNLAGALQGDEDDSGGLFSVELGGGFETDGAFGLEIRPGALGLVAGSGSIDASLAIAARPKTPWIVVGSPGTHRLEVEGFRAGVGVRGQLSDPEFLVNAGTGAGPNPPKIRFVLQMQEGDGFLRKIFGDKPQAVEFGGELQWSSKTGLQFSGQAGITITLPLNLSIADVIKFETLTVALGVSGAGAALTVALSASASLGPVFAAVRNIGVRLSLLPVPQGQKPGAFGDLDLRFGFKPPDGLAVAIDAGPISGGGYIEFDSDNERYAGVLSLSLYGIQITAIGLLDTRLPGGERGYSFLIIISIKFTPIQLGFGFTLNGVGGLCGIQRTMVTEALQAGLRAHTLDHILFPKDPVRNAPQIISDLRTIFPPAEGRYVFGPMVELGWGGGLNLVTAQLGILLEVPEPVVIAILGQLNVVLPDPDAAVVELHLDVLGIIDFGKKLFSLDASLHDSRIAVFSIYGDMAMRLSWGEHPSFALSIGGLNPHFQPPPGFPALKRLTLGLSSGDDFRLSMQSYFAITSNSFQLGARAELYAGIGDYNVYGWLGFDALVIFSPFGFIVDFVAGFALRAGTTVLLAITLEATLSGPTPWHAQGEARITVLFFEVGAHFSVTWGSAQAAELPAVDAWGPLKKAILDRRNWSGRLTAGTRSPVTLVAEEGDEAPVLVEPSGVVELHEKVLPLDFPLTRFGEARPDKQSTFTVDHVTLGGGATGYAPVLDQFARGQFQALSDDQKLTLPSFEELRAGVRIGEATAAFGKAFAADVAYDTRYVDGVSDSKYVISRAAQNAMAAIGAAARSTLLRSGTEKYAVPGEAAPPKVKLGHELFVVASVDELKRRHDITPAASKGAAFDALTRHLATHPADRGRLQVVPLHELEEAA